jgi:hypothetical protein
VSMAVSRKFQNESTTGTGRLLLIAFAFALHPNFSCFVCDDVGRGVSFSETRVVAGVWGLIPQVFSNLFIIYKP